MKINIRELIARKIEGEFYVTELIAYKLASRCLYNVIDDEIIVGPVHLSEGKTETIAEYLQTRLPPKQFPRFYLRRSGVICGQSKISIDTSQDVVV